MAAAENSWINRMRPQYHGVMKWVHVWMLLAWWAQFPRKTACSGRDEVPQRHPSPSAEPPGQSPAEGSASPPQSPDEGPEREDAALENLYSRLLSLRESFAASEASAWLQSAEAHFAEECIPGLEIVAGIASRAHSVTTEQLEREGGLGDSPPKLYDIVEQGQEVVLESALTRAVGPYSFHQEGHCWYLVEADGKRHHQQVWPLDGGVEYRRKSAFTAPDSVQRVLALPALFGRSSLAAVECQHGVRVIRDLLVNLPEAPCLSLPGGRLLNFISVWTPILTTLWSVARTIESDRTCFPESDATLQAVRYNIALQLIELVGLMANRDIWLDRFDITDFTINSRGHIFFQIPGGIQTAAGSHFSGSGDAAAASSSGDRDEWPIYNPNTNAKDLCRILLYLWCPSAASDISIYTLSPTAADVLSVAERCNVPQAVLQIISSVFKVNNHMGRVLSSEAHRELHISLRRLLAGRDGSA